MVKLHLLPAVRLGSMQQLNNASQILAMFNLEVGVNSRGIIRKDVFKQGLRNACKAVSLSYILFYSACFGGRYLSTPLFQHVHKADMDDKETFGTASLS
jgi:hypothetical protein